MVPWWLLPLAFFAGVVVGTVILSFAVAADDGRE